LTISCSCLVFAVAALAGEGAFAQGFTAALVSDELDLDDSEWEEGVAGYGDADEDDSTVLPAMVDR
jgi:hypothetical protein